MDDTIHIDLKLFATLEAKTPHDADHFPVRRGSTIGQVLENLNVSADKAKLIFVNGVKQPLDYRLQDGDRVGIFPPIGGG